jgi:hypothetical protein
MAARRHLRHLLAGAKIMEIAMKKIFAAVALAAIVTSPAFAASAHRHHAATEAMASDMSQSYMQSSGFYAVGPNGAAIGTDPDPNVRQSLRVLGDTNWGD